MKTATSTDPQSDILIIGGGLAGLCAAAHAARSGASVTLLEKGKSLGGRASTQEREGFLLNQGAHALYKAGVGRRTLRDLGIEPRGGIPAQSGGFAIANGVKHTFPGGFLSLLSTGLLSVAGKIDVAKVLATLPRLDTTTYEAMSVNDAARRLSKNAEVQQLLRALVRLATYGNDPDRQSAGDALSQLQLALDANVLYLDGGWQTMTDALRDVATKAGAEVLSSARVDRVSVTPFGVEAAAGDVRYRARSVILATGPREAAELVEGPARETLRSWADESVPSFAACLDVCLESVPSPRANFALGIDQPLYLSVHSAAAKLAPAGRGLIHCMKYIGPSARADPAADERELEGALDLLQPGWRERTVHRRFLPQMLVVHGLPLASRNGVRGRPGPAVPGADNVFVAGDWVGPEGQLADTSLASGRQAGELAAQKRMAAAAA